MKYVNFTGDPSVTSDDFFMAEALKEAQKAFRLNEIPIGAIIVCNGRIIGRGHNLTEQLNDVTAHAEMQAFTAAANYLGGKYLKDCTMYVTLEPCVMCAGASYWTQITRIVFGAYDLQRGFSKLNQPITHPKTTITSGLKEKECGDLIREFFVARRPAK